MANAFNDILGFAGKAADAVLLGGAIGKTKRRNQFTDFLERGEFDQAQQLALRSNEPQFAAYAQQQAALGKSRQDQENALFGNLAFALSSIEDDNVRAEAFEALKPGLKTRYGADDDDFLQVPINNRVALRTWGQSLISPDDAQRAAAGNITAGNVQSRFTDESGAVHLVLNNGKIVNTGISERNPLQSSDIGGVPFAFNRVTGGTVPLSTTEKVGQSEGEIAGLKKQGEARGEAAARLPDTEAKADQSISVIDQILNHPGFDARYGVRGVLPAIPGTAGADFDALRDQLKGQAFLQAFETLKGGGQITEVEGEKATDAISRAFNQSQRPEAARQALEELKRIIATGKARARRKAEGAPNPAPQTVPQRLRYDPQTGELVPAQ